MGPSTVSLAITAVQFSSVAQSGLALCNPMNCSTPGLPVHHQLPESTQTHVHVGDAIQLSYPLSSPSPTAFSLSQHHGLFKWVSSSYSCHLEFCGNLYLFMVFPCLLAYPNNIIFHFTFFNLMVNWSFDLLLGQHYTHEVYAYCSM